MARESATTLDDRDHVRRADTEIAAQRFLDDVEHIAELRTKADIRDSDILDLSSRLRRLLIDRDLQRVANPRIGRIELKSHSEKRYVSDNIGKRIGLLLLGQADIYGLSFGPLLGDPPRRPTGDAGPEIISLPVDKFLNQPVICHEGRWIRRKQVIEFIANTQGGVHTKQRAGLPDAIADDYRALQRLKRGVRFKLKNKTLTIDLWTGARGGTRFPDRRDKYMIDAVSFEVMAAASWLVKSESVQKLERYVRKELDQ